MTLFETYSFCYDKCIEIYYEIIEFALKRMYKTNTHGHLFVYSEIKSRIYSKITKKKSFIQCNQIVIEWYFVLLHVSAVCIRV